jgi:hypothetical protein
MSGWVELLSGETGQAEKHGHNEVFRLHPDSSLDAAQEAEHPPTANWPGWPSNCRAAKPLRTCDRRRLDLDKFPCHYDSRRQLGQVTLDGRASTE